MTFLIPEYLQSKQYSAMRVRGALMDSGLQQGTGPGTTELKVSQRAAGGANMSVDVAPGAAFIKGTTTARQGLYHTYNDAIVNLAVAANASGNPRIDQVIVRIHDITDGAGAQDNAVVSILQGTASAGATLNNRTGAAALPSSAFRLADILVANGAASITDSVIRDKATWATKTKTYDVSAVSILDIPTDVSLDRMIILQYEVALSSPTDLRCFPSNDTSSIYSYSRLGASQHSTPQTLNNMNGAYNHNNGIYLSAVSQGGVGGGMDVVGECTIGLKVLGAVARFARTHAVVGSATGSSNQVVEQQDIANRYGSNSVIPFIRVTTTTGTFSGSITATRI